MVFSFTMNDWNQTPLFRLLPFFIAGILLYLINDQAEFSVVVIASGILMTSMLLAIFVLQRRRSYRWRWVFGLGVWIFSFLSGWLLTALQCQERRPNHFSRETCTAFTGRIIRNPVLKERSVMALAEIFSAKDSGGWHGVEGRLRIYFGKDSSSVLLRYGDVVAFSKQPERVKAPENPEQFDSRRYLGFQQVYSQVFLGAGQWKKTGGGQENFLVAYAYSLRQKLLEVFRRHYIDGQDYAVLSALLLGYEDEIDPEIIHAYAATGALHVLSVSGLHVGIVYLAFNYLLFFMNRNKSAKRWKALLLIAFLWFYALLTGLQPSVLRSAAMLSFTVIGSAMDRRNNTYNSLAASAFVLLAWDPFMLMQMGFQLSYLAVFGIVYLYPKIYHLFYVKNKILKASWGLTSVSISAQLATFPLGLLYFHQFPNYFLLANILIIPLSTVIIYGGILLFILHPFTLLANGLGYLLGLLVQLLNRVAMDIESWPCSVLDGISVSLAETCLVYFALAGFVFFLVYKRPGFLLAAMSVAVLIFAWNIYEFYVHRMIRQLIVFSVPKQSVITYVDGGKGVLLADTAFYNGPGMSYHVNPYLWKIGAEPQLQAGDTSSDAWVTRKPLLKFYDKIILVVDSGFYFSDKTLFPKIDFLILSQNTKIKLDDLFKKTKPKQLIIDSSNSMYKDKQWTALAKEHGVPVYSLLKNGAFVYSLNRMGKVEWRTIVQ